MRTSVYRCTSYTTA